MITSHRLRVLLTVFALSCGAISGPGVRAGGPPSNRLPTGSFTLATSNQNLGSPTIDGDIVAWLGPHDVIEAENLVTRHHYAIRRAGRVSGNSLALSGTTVTWASCNKCQYPTGPDVLYPTGSTIVGGNLVSDAQFRISTVPGTHVLPAISGHFVVWTDVVSHVVYVRNLTLDHEVQLSPFRGEKAAISGTTAVWVDLRNGPNGDIHGKDLVTGRTFLIARHSGPDDYLTDPRISGHIVIWTEWGGGQGMQKAYLVGKNLSTDRQFRIRAMRYGQYNPQFGPATALSDRFVVWEEAPIPFSDSFDIYGMDLRSRRVFRITHGHKGGVIPSVSGNIVVWLDQVGHLWLIKGFVLTA